MMTRTMMMTFSTARIPIQHNFCTCNYNCFFHSMNALIQTTTRSHITKLPPTPFLQTFQDSHLIPQFHKSVLFYHLYFLGMYRFPFRIWIPDLGYMLLTSIGNYRKLKIETKLISSIHYICEYFYITIKFNN